MHLKEKKKITGTKIKERKFYENFSLDRVVLYENLSVLYYFLDGRKIRAGKVERMDEARDPLPGGRGGESIGIGYRVLFLW